MAPPEIVLQGDGVKINLHGETFISKTGVTHTTFNTVPDQPVTSFELTLPEGPYSALTALGNLCAATNTVTVQKKVTVKIHGHTKTITRKVKKTESAMASRCPPNSSPRTAPKSTRTHRSPSPAAPRAVHAKSTKHKGKGGKKSGK